MRQISKIRFTPGGEVSNYFNFLKKFEIRTVRPTKKKPAHLSGQSKVGVKDPLYEYVLVYTQPVVVVTVHV